MGWLGDWLGFTVSKDKGQKQESPNKPPQMKWKKSDFKIKGDSGGYYKWKKGKDKKKTKKWVEVKDLTRINDLMRKAEGMEYPEFGDWMDQKGYSLKGTDEYMEGIQSLMDEFEAGPDAEKQGQFASRLTEELTGIDDIGAELERLRGQIESGEGMTDEQRFRRERYYEAEIAKLERKAMEDIQRMTAGSVSTYAMLSKADESRRMIKDARIQSMVAIDDEEWRRVEAKSQMYAQLLNTQQISAEQYWEQKKTAYAGLFQGYAMQMDDVYRQNEQYFRMYEDEMRRVTEVIDSYYKAIQIEMGVDKHLIDMYEAASEDFYAEYYRELEEWGIEQETYALREQQSREDLGLFLDFFSSIVSLGLSV